MNPCDLFIIEPFAQSHTPTPTDFSLKYNIWIHTVSKAHLGFILTTISFVLSSYFKGYLAWPFKNITSTQEEFTILQEQVNSKYVRNFESLLLTGILTYFILRLWLCPDLFVVEDTKAWL